MNPQPGIFATGDAEHSYVELDRQPGAGAHELARALAGLFAKNTPLVGVSCVAGMRPELWAEAVPTAAHPGARSFEEVAGRELTLPATQHDAWLWVAGSHRDAVFDNTLRVVDTLAAVASPASELTGWVHLLNRDLTGFIDGTENPTGAKALHVACLADGPAAGSSVLLFQKWIHFSSWRSLSVEQQELVIGRRKADSQELSQEVMPKDSHVARNVVEEEGEQLEIFRRNTAWGGPTEHGTVFVGFSAELHRLQVLLERMVGLPDGVRDALSRYTVALSGAYYVIPSLDSLAALAPGG